MNNLSFANSRDIKAEEKRLYEEYKKKVSELKKLKKEKDAVGQVFTKGLLPLYVLHILNFGPTTGNYISHDIGERTNGKWVPSTGGIYPLLKTLEKDGLVIGNWDDPKKKFRKIYSLTPEGKREYLRKKALLKPKIEEALEVFKLVYNDIY
ncbi:PadR family transcriptional regulator [Clostridium sp.]|uniref:PadR family transcriptional regulator n=1 Tax=Clostridium sp. TaxID=1506 RepID=UPI002A919B6E|nr:PadR family transcriptional regulator [Clostridium sp.]MDY6011328.1 PadR family transcriptional regulator [Clostridium sp.]